MIYKDPNLLQHKALELIERHLDQLLAQGDVANSMAIVIQNYTKVLIMAAKDQRDQLRGFNPSAYTDEELDRLASAAEKSLSEEKSDDDTDET
jgi:hypothetical protein